MACTTSLICKGMNSEPLPLTNLYSKSHINQEFNAKYINAISKSSQNLVLITLYFYQVQKAACKILIKKEEPQIAQKIDTFANLQPI